MLSETVSQNKRTDYREAHMSSQVSDQNPETVQTVKCDQR